VYLLLSETPSPSDSHHQRATIAYPSLSVCISSFHPSWVSSTPRSHDHPNKTPRKGNAEGSKGSHVEPEKQTRIGRRKRHKNQRTLSYRRTPHCCLNSPLLCSCRTSKLDISSASRTRSKVQSQYLPSSRVCYTIKASKPEPARRESPEYSQQERTHEGPSL
jgi:hypothetical protein